MATREHLERLIIEIYGAEEGARKLKALEGAEKDLAKQSKETAVDLKKAGAALAAFAALALKASADLETANGRLERSAQRAGANMATMGKQLAEADGRSRRLGVGLADTRNHLSSMIDAAGDAATAMADYALAQDIAATGDVELREAVELLTRARKGEVEELKKLDGFTKDNAESLGKVKHQATRAQIAVDMLTKSYSGAADELKDTNTALDNLKQAGKDWLAVIGDTGRGLINRTAEYLNIVDEGESLIDRFALGLRNAADEARVLDVVLEAAQRRLADGGAFSGRSFDDYIGDVARDRAAAQRSRNAGTFLKNARRRARGETNAPREVDEELLNAYSDGTYGPQQPKASRSRGGEASEGPSGFEGDFTGGSIITLEEELQSRRLESWKEFHDKKEEITLEAAKRQVEIERQAAEDSKRALKETIDVFEGDSPLEHAGKKAEEGKKKTVEAINATVEAGATLTNSFVKDEGAKASILGAIEVGRSIAAAATGNPAGAIGHAAAAVQFFAAAAQAGIGGGAKSKMGGGGTRQRGVKGARFKKGDAGGVDPQAQDRERIGRIGGSSRVSDAQAPIVINIGSTLGFHPEQTREFVGELEREMRSRTGGTFGGMRR